MVRGCLFRAGMAGLQATLRPVGKVGYAFYSRRRLFVGLWVRCFSTRYWLKSRADGIHILAGVNKPVSNGHQKV